MNYSPRNKYSRGKYRVKTTANIVVKLKDNEERKDEIYSTKKPKNTNM